MNILRTVLIIEDQEVNRDILEEILKDDCYVVQASNGMEGLDILKKREDIAAIILDIVMPEMDGFEFLRELKKIPEKRNIPVIVATEHGTFENERKALELGAYDFSPKPYNGPIVRLRVKNAIEHSRLVTLENLKYLEDYDGLTGIYNKNGFMLATRQMLDEENPDDKYAIIRFDVTRFSMINAYYGIEEGDRLLKFIAQKLREEGVNHHRTVYGRLGADDFCMCTRYADIDQIYTGIERAKAALSSYDLSFNIVMIFGVYLITDRSQNIEAMIANANLAAKRIKGNYLNTIAFYDEKLSKQREQEQEIINEMKTALEKEQFVVYLQPKYNSHTNLPCGAEALIRWNHPQKGLIPPGVFIPVFESNGFVEPIDHYIWEHVCILLRKWIDEGIDPNPVSVNVSRVNLYNPRIVEEISELTEKYRVPKELLQLEITESAYTDNGDLILSVINKFHDNGFTILMDDFGSGYSSLNVLKDMHVDVLKIDMKFFGRTENTSRAETIISSVVRMAKWLSIGLVAEGVETKEQVDFLRDNGCLTIQGYYYAKPMPVEDYEKLISSGAKFVDEKNSIAADNFEWNNSAEIDELFANDMNPICLSEVRNGDVEIERVNMKYYELFGYEDTIMFVKHPMDRALEEYKTGLLNAYLKVAKTKKDQEYKYLRYDSKGDILDLRIELKYLKSNDDSCLVLCYFYKNDELSDDKKDEELHIKKVIEMCCERAKQREEVKSYVSACGHLPELVNTVLASRYLDKHAMIIVSVDNVGEVEKKVDPHMCNVMWNSMELVLNQHFRTNDMVAKTDDHEYCIFMSSVPSEEVVSHKCHELNRMLKMFANVSKFPVKISIGVAISNKDDRDFENLYNNAVIALKKGREHGGNRVYMMANSEI